MTLQVSRAHSGAHVESGACISSAAAAAPECWRTAAFTPGLKAAAWKRWFSWRTTWPGRGSETKGAVQRRGLAGVEKVGKRLLLSQNDRLLLRKGLDFHFSVWPIHKFGFLLLLSGFFSWLPAQTGSWRSTKGRFEVPRTFLVWKCSNFILSSFL